MDFTFDEDLRALAGLADDIVTGHATTGRVAEVEAGGTRVDDGLWRALAVANLLGIALPERHGGSGLGMSGLCVVLEALGRRVAPVP
ncbi:acyl-CoA dehydrogenase family protein, partial [Saccharomonospora halophila]|uniref:acyl-CoA dehydrogenase family protein n=1 Tax=Saccharomonospora halophila TaxID=129922 RepID=UPI000491E2FB